VKRKWRAEKNKEEELGVKEEKQGGGIKKEEREKRKRW
jgi:hypothetical protein